MESARMRPASSEQRSSPKAKFLAYQNATLSAALTAHSLRPSPSALLLLLFASLASATFLISVFSMYVSLLYPFLAFGHLVFAQSCDLCVLQFLVKLLEAVVGLVFIASLSALIRALSLRNPTNALGNASAASPSQENKEVKNVLTQRQLALLGMRQKAAERFTDAEPIKKPPRSRPVPSSEPLVPIRRSSFSYTPSHSSRVGPDQLCSSGGKKAALSPMSPPSSHSHVASPSTPWSRHSAGSAKGIQSEVMLEQYLAEVDERIVESAAIAVTPPPPVRGIVISSPSSVATQSTPSGAARSTPLRPARMSPGSHQKYNTPPKKGEGELPAPMSMEQAVEAFEYLGIYPQIELWRDRLRQWFSAILINPLREKIDTSHSQVMQAAAKVGTSITVSQVGSESPSTSPPFMLSPVGGAREWLPTVTVDEDGLLHQLRAFLLQARDGSMCQLQSLLVYLPCSFWF
ncbi:hypothetical protein B296_00028139 [Ensete ventricosum]|uniref:Uncharacterized protein n=1 Tax=Ensete ventricosum TaxID=4639 RepID=A0A426Z415_ENSVE|nr:hypothetical protein B296_00028139 [Ensete ventricosum]